MTLQHYDVWLGKGEMGLDKDYTPSWNGTAEGLYQSSETWFQAARVIQSIVSLLTIPVASAVCGSAAVVYAQRGKRTKDLSLGQLVLLADKTWSDPLTIIDLLFGKLVRRKNSQRRNRSKHSYASALLVLAILLHLLGSIIAPLQQILLGSKTIHVPTGPQLVIKLTDLPGQWSFGTETDGTEVATKDLNYVVLLTRTALETAVNTQPQAQLWPGANLKCDNNVPSESGIGYFCGRGATLGDMSKLNDPFLAELPSYYHTGLIRQFIPRINSTATYEQIPENEFPRGCEKAVGGFYANYQNTTTNPDVTTIWGVQACMPNDNRHPPWKFNRDRQDFTEEMYLNITLGGQLFKLEKPTHSYVKITLHTTAGYFELPNYNNKRVAGPLLDKDPFMNGDCGHDCVNGTNKDLSPFDPNRWAPQKREDTNNTYDPVELERIQNKGPLLTTAMALFGRGSFIQTRLANPEAYAGMPYPYPDGKREKVIDAGKACGYLRPMGALFLDPDTTGSPITGDKSRGSCIFNADSVEGEGLRDEVARWLRLFTNYTDPDRLTNGFTAAAFFANQNWLLNQAQSAGDSPLTVYYDEGMEIQAPEISMAGIIAMSVLLGLYLAMLLALAVYAAWTPRWTRTLDSFVMMRVGAAYGQYFPLNVGTGIQDVEDAHRLPGTVGAVIDGEESVRRLELGAIGRVGPGKYLRYRLRK
jgi:hypothetical protein